MDENITFNVVKNRLEVVLNDLTVDLGPSSTGKTRLVATKRFELGGSHSGVIIQMTAYRKVRQSQAA